MPKIDAVRVNEAVTTAQKAMVSAVRKCARLGAPVRAMALFVRDDGTTRFRVIYKRP